MCHVVYHPLSNPITAFVNTNYELRVFRLIPEQIKTVGGNTILNGTSNRVVVTSEQPHKTVTHLVTLTLSIEPRVFRFLVFRKHNATALTQTCLHPKEKPTTAFILQDLDRNRKF